jgi:transcriptional regulator with XRE-family HTH domain
MKFGNYIRRCRQAAGLSLRELAEFGQISPVEYSAYHDVCRVLALHLYQRENLEESGMILLLNQLFSTF